MKKRNVINKPKKIKCRICDKYFSGYSIVSHILYSHKDITIDQYVKKYGEFRKNKLIERKGKRNIKRIVCKICNKEYSIVGMFTHLRDSHNITPDEYAKKYVEYRPKYADYKERAEKNKIECKICKKYFGSERLLSYHLRIDHNIKDKKSEYIIPYIFDNKKQYCKCGCNEEIKIVNQFPYRINYVSGHNPNGMIGKKHKNSSKKKMSVKAILRIGKTNKSNTDIEILLKKFFNDNDIKFEHQYQTEFGSMDFYLPKYNYYIEVDGSFWHKEKKKSMNFFQVANSISEYKKESLSNLYRIKGEDIQYLRNLSDLLKSSYSPDYSIKYRQKIINKEYFENYLKIKGKDKLRKYIPLLLKFIRTFQPSFPYLPQEENLQEVIMKIRNYDLTKLKDKNMFRNNSSTIGINYLKSNFKSYWNSSFKGQKTPVEVWQEDDLMKKIIEYRIGLNNSGEIFDFSLHQLIRGISARRFTISFFKPILAAAIYKEYLKDKKQPIVIDPCAGFGGRLLGFKSIYPEGTYIGIEPNEDTFSELEKLTEESGFRNVKLHNCKFEDFIDIPNNYDLVFTSIPYFDIEVYSQNIEYKDFTEWKDKFFNKFYEFHNVRINLNQELYDKINNLDKSEVEFKILNNSSHFSYKDDKQELMVKLK